MKTVLTVGVFDLLHLGHIKLFQKAKILGDCLIVAVQTDEYVYKSKPNTKLFIPLEDRKYMVESIRYVDEVLEYNTIDELVQNIEFDILAVGPDQNHLKFQKAFEWCYQRGKKVEIIPRTEGISSSLIRQNIN